jgi:hypothetical protein
MLRSCLVGGIAGTRHGRLRHITTERLGAVMFSSAHLPSQLVALAAIWHPRNEWTVW